MQPTESCCRSVRSSLTAVAARSGVCLLVRAQEEPLFSSVCPRIKSSMSLKQLIDCFPSFYSQQTSLSSPLFTSGEGGPPAHPGPLASCWPNRGTEDSSSAHARDIWPFPRYLIATGRCSWCARRHAKLLDLVQRSILEILQYYGAVAAKCVSRQGLRHGVRVTGCSSAGAYRLPVTSRVIQQQPIV